MAQSISPGGAIAFPETYQQEMLFWSLFLGPETSVFVNTYLCL